MRTIRKTVGEITRDGVALLVMGFTGRQAMERKIRSLDAFDRMKAVQIDKVPALLDRPWGRVMRERERL